MTTLRCRCGGKFSVQPGFAGRIVVAPCCQTKVRVPSAVSTPPRSGSSGPAKPAASPSVLAKCRCGQKLRVPKQASAVEVKCPKCGQRLRVPGSNLSFENHTSHLPNVAEAILKPYPTGATVTVYHDPESPTSSVLEKGTQSGNQFETWIGIAAILCGLFIFYDCIAGGINERRFPQPATR